MRNKMKDMVSKPNTSALLERLGFRSKIIVIKYGGNAMLDDGLKDSVAADIVQLKKIGLKPIIVHGGGPAVSNQMEKEGMEPEFVHGQRKTDGETLGIAEMVLSGKVNKELVRRINERNGNAVGISGKDGTLVKSRKTKKEMEVDGKMEKVDLGRVGEVYNVDTTLVETLIENDFITVISPICAGDDEGDFNVNADILAGELASSLKADSLMYLTNVDGIREKKDDEKTRMKKVHIKKAESLIGKKIQGGMIPKVESAVKAIRNGVKTVRIIDGTKKHSLLQAFEKSSDYGTVIYADKEE
jgi:acetylglutamate kinase